MHVGIAHTVTEEQNFVRADYSARHKLDLRFAALKFLSPYAGSALPTTLIRAAAGRSDLVPGCSESAIAGNTAGYCRGLTIPPTFT